MNKRNIVIAVLLTMVLMLTACQTPSVETNTTENNFSEENVTAPIVDETTSENATPQEIEQPKVDDVDFSKASFKVVGTEGDLVKVPVKAVDLDGDSLKYTFAKPFNDQGMWLTQIGDEGKYLVKVTVSDGLVSTSEFVLVEVKRANRAPTIECPDIMNVQETDTIRIDCNIFDEEGDPVIVGYEGWMRISTYPTTYGDFGEHSVIVRAKDQNHETTKNIKIIVEKKNRAPVITSLETQEIMETEKIQITPEVYDPDGDVVLVSFSEPLSADGSWTPQYGDRGEYTVVVTASDGKTNVTSEFNLVALKKNRVPVLKQIEQLEVFEGDKVSIPVQAYDPDGDDITVTYSGWKEVGEFTTSYDDAYPEGCNSKGCTATYYVDVTVSDGTLVATQNVKIKVTDKNRPPELLWD
ncbi:MAG: hypothetical protein WC758_06745 [Candidatus Woesearchaeota archaeon]|jgi:hypothetical protein